MSYYTAKQNSLLSAISSPIPWLLLVPLARNYLRLLSYHETWADYVQKPKSEVRGSLSRLSKQGT